MRSEVAQCCNVHSKTDKRPSADNYPYHINAKNQKHYRHNTKISVSAVCICRHHTAPHCNRYDSQFKHVYFNLIHVPHWIFGKCEKRYIPSSNVSVRIITVNYCTRFIICRHLGYMFTSAIPMTARWRVISAYNTILA